MQVFDLYLTSVCVIITYVLSTQVKETAPGKIYDEIMTGTMTVPSAATYGWGIAARCAAWAVRALAATARRRSCRRVCGGPRVRSTVARLPFL